MVNLVGFFGLQPWNSSLRNLTFSELASQEARIPARFQDSTDLQTGL